MISREEIDEIAFARLKRDFSSGDEGSRLQAVEKLVSCGGADVVSFFIGQLSNPLSELRNCAAIGLRVLRDPSAVGPLLSAIHTPIDEKSTGTFVYALQTHDCTDRLVDLFRVLFYRSYESKMMVSSILDEQIFEFSEDDLFEIRDMWEICKANPSLCPAFEDSVESIQSEVDGFLAYLEAGV